MRRMWPLLVMIWENSADSILLEKSAKLLFIILFISVLESYSGKDLIA
jgi:hypothetical protein